jgi:hypothetical protein
VELKINDILVLKCLNSVDTVDGGPVVEFGAANPNQLIYQTNGNEGSFRLS